MDVSGEVPIKQFVSFSFKDFVSGLLSHPGFEDHMDSPHTCSVGEDMRNIFDGRFLQDFKLPDGQPFRSTIDVGRYSFSLCVDFFNHSQTSKLARRVPLGSSLLFVLISPLRCDIKQRICS